MDHQPFCRRSRGKSWTLLLSSAELTFVFAPGASTTEDILKIRIQLTKPVTWIPLIWGVLCGAAASGARGSLIACF